MKLTWRRIWLAGIALAAAWLLGGCTAPASAESLFTLPQLPIEYTDLSRQINDLIADGYEYASPSSGRNIQSVQMVDLDGDGDEEAVAFFRRSNDEKPLKIFIFSASEDTYQLLCTIESSGTAVDSAYYQDLTGDGQMELIVGWRISTDVQTVAAYSIGREPQVLMQSGYVRYSIEELDGDGIPSLLLFRLDDEGNSVAEFYSWRDDMMTVSYSAGLTSTMAELSRGSVVSGRLQGGQSAVFVTGVTEEGMAVTDIITYRPGTGLINIALDAQTGNSGVFSPYMLLRPQDMDGDGVIEVPRPQEKDNDQLTGVVDWVSYDGDGQPTLVMTTYHNLAAGWYFILPEEWQGRVTVTDIDSGVNEMQTILLVDGREAGVIYTLTGENRENRALRGNRMVIKRQSGITYAGEILPDGRDCGLTDAMLHQNFKLIVNQWTNG